MNLPDAPRLGFGCVPERFSLPTQRLELRGRHYALVLERIINKDCEQFNIYGVDEGKWDDAIRDSCGDTPNIRHPGYPAYYVNSEGMTLYLGVVSLQNSEFPFTLTLNFQADDVVMDTVIDNTPEENEGIRDVVQYCLTTLITEHILGLRAKERYLYLYYPDSHRYSPEERIERARKFVGNLISGNPYIVLDLERDATASEFRIKLPICVDAYPNAGRL